MSMDFRITSNVSSGDSNGYLLRIRCPVCHQNGAFEAVLSHDLVAPSIEGGQSLRFGQRRCPDTICGGHVFFIHNVTTGQLLTSYPAESLDFDTTNIPDRIQQTLAEAIVCHSHQCFTAAAIMVRKTLEELCEDRGAKGKTLKERIAQLGQKVVLPTELLEGLDELRLLGNDAAHIESHEFDQVGSEEVEVGIEFAKEVLKATFQYATLLNRLKGLKKAT